MTGYSEFLASKGARAEAKGLEPSLVNPMLYPFQRGIVEWALRRGRAAIFADCGMGKSFMQVEWARQVAAQTKGRVLIVAPIAVGQQTIGEAAKLGVRIVRTVGQVDAPLQVTNYEQLHKFDPAHFSGVVLDESSILKSLDGKTRGDLLERWVAVPYRLACTATPAPNDTSELANHAEFLGAMSRVEMLATFFVHDMDDGGWRLKGHAAGDMWRWMAQWAVFVRRPSDLGFADEGWALPPLSIVDERVETGLTVDVGGISKRAQVRRMTMAKRLEKLAEVVKGNADQWLIWCGLNDEQDAIEQLFTGECVSVRGATPEDKRVEYLEAFKSGLARILIAKPSQFGFGLNLQHCHRMAFFGLGDSFESYYQAVRRCWRFGQTEPVDVRIIVSDVEGGIADNVKRKEAEALAMAESVVSAVREEQTGEVRQREDKYEPKIKSARGAWALVNGDSCEMIKRVPTGSVGLSVFSPPFSSLYTYSSSSRDLGNCKDDGQFFEHMSFLIPELLRVTMPGRRAAVHCQQLSTTKATWGYIGWRDFRGELIRAFTKGGWIYDGEICIDKNPQAQAIRTKSKQLMFVQKEKDSSWLRPAMADYILLFRHPEENPNTPVKTDVSNEEWILFAHPIWYGIRESDTLKYRDAREADDEKHICPLQLETIERCIRLWSNPGDLILSPFAGIGSEGYVARRFGRRFYGIELKESYWAMACKNLEQADSEGVRQPTRAEGLDEIEAKRKGAA